MITEQALRQVRTRFDRHAWADAYAHLSAADREVGLEPAELESLATMAYLVGEHEASEEAWARAHHEHLGRGRVEPAARCAFWLAFGLLWNGDDVRAGGWMARARRLLDDGERDCVESGYLLLPTALQSVDEGDLAGAQAAFRRAGEIGERFGELDLLTFARHGVGRVLIRMGDIERGVGLLDEAMAAIEAGDVSPMVVGDVYCSVIEGCLEAFDLRRAHGWTAALSRWCDSQPDLVPYRGQCLVRRAEILQLRGDWTGAMVEARRACAWLSRPPTQRAIGAALYQQAEIHRLHGRLEEAETAYRQASEWGRRPEPGLAQLRLDQGRVGMAHTIIRRALGEAEGRVARCRLLPAGVEIALAAGDLEAADSAAGELTALAEAIDAPLPRACAAQARGALLLARGDAEAALFALRDACRAWQELEVPYEVARVRVLIGLACQRLGDPEAAAVELDAARSALADLGAASELARLERLTGTPAPDGTAELTRRELEVLRLVATGMTNRSIAAELFISHRTVDRHVSNILCKLGVPSRSAATAYAYEHELAWPGPHPAPRATDAAFAAPRPDQASRSVARIALGGSRERPSSSATRR